MDRWMVIWTRPGQEFPVASHLREIGFDAFVPSIRKERPSKINTRNRGKGVGLLHETVTLAAFPRYLMFTATEAQPIWQKALRVDGVTLVVRRAGDRVEPGILPQHVVAMLRGENGDGVIKDLTKTVKAIERFAKGLNVEITSGPFGGFPGVVVGHEGKNVRVLLSLFGQQTEAAIAPGSIKAA